MGNNCVADGKRPHQNHIQVENHLPYALCLDESRGCGEKCNHRGFGAPHGKFPKNCEPKGRIEPGESHQIRVSGREASAVAPDAWMQYRINDGRGWALVDLSMAGWLSGQSRSFVRVTFGGDPGDVRVNVNRLSEGEGEGMASFTDSISRDKQFCVRFFNNRQFRQKQEAGKEPLLWGTVAAGVLAAPAAMLLPRKRVALIIDGTQRRGSPEAFWWLGMYATAGAFAHRVDSRRADGFREAVADLRRQARPEKKIEELHFWCHGSSPGQVFCGGTALQPDYLACLKDVVEPGAAVWFRCCLAFGEREGFPPGPRVNDFVRAVCTAGGFRYAGGHNVVIGQQHKSCYLYDAQTGQWHDPMEASGAPLELLKQTFGIDG